MNGGDVSGGTTASVGRPARMKKRADFVAATKHGLRRRAKYFTLQACARADAEGPARFGLTVSKKTSPLSVRRNRIRRRLREALRQGAALSAAAGSDYVFVARLEALSAPFSELQRSIAATLADAGAQRRRNRPSDR